MGTQFFWFFDIVIIAIFIGVIIKCARKGFVGTIFGFLAIFIAFLIALPLSETISNAIYDNIVKESVVKEINQTLEGTFTNRIITDLKTVDMSKAKINGREVSELNIQPDSAGRITLDLSVLDLTGTGISNIDLSPLGVDNTDIDYSSMNLGTVQITQSEIERYGLNAMLLADVVSDRIAKGTQFGSLCTVIDSVNELVPAFVGGTSDSSAGNRSMLKNIVVSVMENDAESIAERILGTIIKPVVLVPIRALVFILLFVILMILLNLIAKALKIVNKIPIIGSVNAVLGAIVGVLEAAVVVFIVCIGVQAIINLTDNKLIFLNSMTVDRTLLFRHIYYFDFLNFLG